MPKAPEVRRQISVALSRVQTDWVHQQALRRGISDAEFVRRLIDGMMLGDNTMSRGVDWQPQTLPTPASLMRNEDTGQTPGFRARAAALRAARDTDWLRRVSGIPEIKSTPMGPAHPLYEEYVKALRSGDTAKALEIRNGTMGAGPGAGNGEKE